MSDRYAVFRYKTGAFVSGVRGGLAWTTDRREADETAQMVDGAVVDADDFRHNWPLYMLTAWLAGEMPREVAARRLPAEWLTPYVREAYVRIQDAQRSGT